jgi:hypothetical protein
MVVRVAQAVTAAIDVQDVAGVQQSVEDGGRDGFVAAQHLGPIADAHVRAMREAGSFAGERRETDLIDEEQDGVPVLPSREASGRHASIPPQVLEQFHDSEKDDEESAFDGGDTESGSEMARVDAWRPEQEQWLPIADLQGDGQGFDPTPLDGGLEGEVEAGQCCAVGRPEQLQAAAEVALLASRRLRGQQAVEEDAVP